MQSFDGPNTRTGCYIWNWEKVNSTSINSNDQTEIKIWTYKQLKYSKTSYGQQDKYTGENIYHI